MSLPTHVPDAAAGRRPATGVRLIRVRDGEKVMPG